MAAPVITGTTPAGPLTFAPGEVKAIRVNAFDPDNGPPVSQVFNVQDAGGATTPITVTLQVQDSLSYSAGPAPSGWSVAQDANDPALFRITAP